MEREEPVTQSSVNPFCWAADPFCWVSFTKAARSRARSAVPEVPLSSFLPVASSRLSQGALPSPYSPSVLLPVERPVSLTARKAPSRRLHSQAVLLARPRAKPKSGFLVQNVLRISK